MGSWGESGEAGGEEVVGAGAALGSLFKVAEALRPLGWIRLAQLRTVCRVLNRRPSAGEMKAKVDKGRVKGIDSGGMQGKCDR